jgi:hypothetical protein
MNKLAQYRRILAVYGPAERETYGFFCPDLQLVLASTGTPADYTPMPGSTRFMHNGINPPIRTI